MKVFNTTTICIPSKHYMVDLTERVAEIKKMIDAGKYFTINRARQYGKTTTITAIQNELKEEYEIVSLSFEGIGDAGFADETSFVKAFCRKLKREYRAGRSLPENVKAQFEDFLRRDKKTGMDELFDAFLDWCEESEKGIVLIIDEVDSASNYQVFLDFLGGLRDSYINRDAKGMPAFLSVILVGVNDIKHLKSRIRPDVGHQYNSPWNVASDFRIDMSLSEHGICGMLTEYEADHHTGMDIALMAAQLRSYTNGYPFLVSRLCQLIDEQLVPETFGSLCGAWTERGLNEAVKLLLTENNTLFQSLTKNLENNPELKAGIRSILMEGARIPYNAQQDDIAQMEMYGFIRNEYSTVRIANRIFEMMLYNLFLSDEELKSNAFFRRGDLARNIFVRDGILNMRLILERFTETYMEIYGPLEEKFKEKDGRELFLLYLKPIINGTGNYYIEAQTRDQTRTDVIVDYPGQQYIVELKIWRGDRYNAEGEKQISEYLDYFGLSTGYMLSFNFNKHKEQGVRQVYIGEKLLYEATV
ncbi:MAG: AAA-like domain-containing protein [Lachnospiraceae bacterium]|nr:AAA-like domain-containing protein [Lachnospiraceae bacterium]